MPRPALNPLRRAAALLPPPRCSSSFSSSASPFAARLARPPPPTLRRTTTMSTTGTTTTTTTTTTMAMLPASSSSSSSACRLFSTTRPAQTKTIKPHRLPSRLIPPYPYGERRTYKQSNRGLYGSARLRFGNTVAPKYKNKSPRFWRPNVHVKIFHSPALGARIKTRLTLRVLKTIRREGGIDEYLLKSKPARIKEIGPGGWNLRWLLMQTQAVQRRFNDERVALGLEPKEVEDRDDIIQYALDFATPGPLSVRSRATLDALRAPTQDAFVLGDDDLAQVQGVEELSDEAEELLLRESSGRQQNPADEVQGGKQGAEA